jgi:hypothetical protein
MAPSSARMIAARRVAFSCLSVALMTAPANSQIPSVDSLRQVLTRTTYVFEGVIQSWNSVADPSLMPTPNTARVRVTRVFSCPVPVGDFNNEEVTIRYPDPTAGPRGERAWFFGVGWSIGDHIATTSLSVVHTPTQLLVDSLLGNLRAAIHLDAEERLRAEATAADTIVIATVRSVGPPLLPRDMGRTEHAERWSSVRLTVDSVHGFKQSGTGRNATSVIGWVVPSASARNMTILAPAIVGYDTTTATRLAPNLQFLLLLDLTLHRPNLQTLDPKAKAFLPKQSNIHPVHDITLLGAVLPNPVFSVERQHECTQPFR